MNLIFNADEQKKSHQLFWRIKVKEIRNEFSADEKKKVVSYFGGRKIFFCPGPVGHCQSTPGSHGSFFVTIFFIKLVFRTHSKLFQFSIDVYSIL